MRSVEAAPADDPAAGTRERYDVVLLDGSPRRLSVWLAHDIAREDTIEVDGCGWLVADVRHPEDAAVQLICIHEG